MANSPHPQAQAQPLGYAELLDLIGHREGIHNVACPLCGPYRRAAVNRRRQVLRVWYAAGFATYACARCGEHGYARGDVRKVDRGALAKARAAANERAAVTDRDKRRRAQWFWDRRLPIGGTPAERYLRVARAYSGPLPPTIGFLPGRGDHSAALISAFGMPDEVEPGVMSITTAAVRGVHLTKLAPDGSAKAGTDTDKIMLGCARGAPIALAAIGDSLGLAVTEGIEDALSVHEATGLGSWAAGAASLMPALAPVIPDWVEIVTILVDDDLAGRRNAEDLAQRLAQRDIAVRFVVPALAGVA
jgi:hypothetical protein